MSYLPKEKVCVKRSCQEWLLRHTGMCMTKSAYPFGMPFMCPLQACPQGEHAEAGRGSLECLRSHPVPMLCSLAFGKGSFCMMCLAKAYQHLPSTFDSGWCVGKPRPERVILYTPGVLSCLPFKKQAPLFSFPVM